MNETIRISTLNSSPKSFAPGIQNILEGRERYYIRGGAMVVIALNAGDQIEIVDPEGLQCVHIVAFDASCNFSSGQFTPDRMTNGVKLASMLEQVSPGATKIKQKLKLFGIELASAPTAVLLDGQSSPGSRVSRVVEKECIGIFGAPGGPMSASEQNPPTDLILWITRCTKSEDEIEIPTDPWRMQFKTLPSRRLPQRVMKSRRENTSRFSTSAAVNVQTFSALIRRHSTADWSEILMRPRPVRWSVLRTPSQVYIPNSLMSA